MRMTSILAAAVISSVAAMSAAFAQQPQNPPATASATQPQSYWSLVRTSDPADLAVYRDANAKLPPPAAGEERVVFLGDSITENWQRTFPQNYPNRPNYIGRGRTSETTFQMLIRFRPDIVNLHPKVVVIMAGVNDVAGNTGAETDEQIHDNFVSMFDIARANGIKVILVSTLPATNFFWQPGIDGASQRVKKLVGWEKEYAASHGLFFVDAFDTFKDEKDGMPATYSSDTVHPNALGYQLLSGMVEAQIQNALGHEVTGVTPAPATVPAPDQPARGFGGRGGGRGGGGAGRTPVPAPTPTPMADLGMPIPAGALPIRTPGPGQNLSYVPPADIAPPIVGSSGRGPSDPYWIAAIQADPADLKVYQKANALIGAPKPGENRVVFLGDSIIEKWQPLFAASFPGKSSYVGRGIPAETTMQMLVRFRPDVIDLGAKVVVLQGGIGDIAGNTGDVPDATIHDNFAAILDLARVNNIKVVWISTLPASRLFWQPSVDPIKRVADLAQWEKDYAATNGVQFVDAYSALLTQSGGLIRTYSDDGVHPNAAGYAVLSPMVEKAIEQTLTSK